MGKMTDGSGHIVMLPVIKKNRYCTQSLHEFHIAVNLLL